MIDLTGLVVNACNLTVLRAREVLDDVVKQRVNALAQNARTHGHGNDRTIANADAQCGTDLSLGEFLTAKITLHHLFTGLCYGFH